ncbi:MAG: hypothetical protein WBO36_09435, partial [Saprospiraceae bacterium]
LNSLWQQFTVDDKAKNTADYIVEMELLNMAFSPERERSNSYVESNEILIRKDKVKERRDSVDVWVEKEVYERVKAEVIEVFREKKAELNGAIHIFDNRTREKIKTVPVNVFNDFVGYGCRFLGDERALTAASKKKMDGFLELFPPDSHMADELTTAYRNVVTNEVRRMKFQ